MNYEEAAKFLTAMGQQVSTFQTFCDQKIGKDFTEDQISNFELNRKKLTKVIHGPLENVFSQLQYLNELNAGIFFTPNTTDRLGRSNKNIIKINSVFADHDDISKSIDLPLTPSIIVSSGRGYHYYWLVNEFNDLSKFSTVQAAIASKLGTDKSVIDLARVMRLPGTYHKKDLKNIRPVEVVSLENRKYRFDEIIKAFEIDLNRRISTYANYSSRSFKPQINHLLVNRRKKQLNGLNRIFDSCPAFGEINKKVLSKQVLSHLDGFALYHLCINFSQGHDWFVANVSGWGSSPSDMKQLQHSVEKDYRPWGCKTLQEKGICKFINPNQCMPPLLVRGGAVQPNPFRFA